MSWISDVRDELEQLDRTVKRLKQFGYLMAAVSGAIAGWIYLNKGFNLNQYIFDFLMVFFLLSVLINPKIIKFIYGIWMSLAFTLGWLISRVILVIVYYTVVTPIGLIGRLFGKRWMDVDFRIKKDSYWIKKTNQKVNYEKLY